MYLLPLRLLVDIRIKIWLILDTSAGDYVIEQIVRNILVLARERDRLPDERVEVKRAVELRLPLGQREIKLGELRSGRIVGDSDVPHPVGVLNREMEGRGV